MPYYIILFSLDLNSIFASVFPNAVNTYLLPIQGRTLCLSLLLKYTKLPFDGLMIIPFSNSNSPPLKSSFKNII